MPSLTIRPIASSLVLAGLLITGCASNRLLPLTPAPSTPVDLTGNWKLDPSQSEDPGAKIASSGGGSAGGGGHGHGGHGGGGFGGGGGGGGGFGGHGGMGGMGGGHGGGSSSAADADGAAGGPSRQMAWPVSMAIRQDATTLHVNADGVQRDLPLVSSGSDDPRQPITGWYGSEFVTETGGKGRMQIMQRYALSPDHSQLSVRTEITSKQRSEPRTIWRVFKRAP